MAFSWSKFQQAVMFTAPLVLPAFGVPAPLVNLAIHGVLVAEAAANGSPKTGEEKKAIALQVVQDGIGAVNAARPGTLNSDELMGAVSEGIDATISAVKAAKDIPAHPGV